MKTTPDESNLASYVIHYSPLEERRVFLEPLLVGLQPEWVTEKDVVVPSLPWRHKEKVLGIGKRKIAADLGVNARSLSRSRRRARLESFVLRYLSLFGKRFYAHTYGSLPKFQRLPSQILELNSMHVYSLFLFLQSDCEWGLFLEDDAIPAQDFFSKLEKIANLRMNKPIWINLNSGAGLVRTSSDPQPDQYGLFRVIPANTRCATAYMINRAYAVRVKDLILVHGLADWLPIDVFYQVANRKLRAKSFWIEPPVVVQGSESGQYDSGLGKHR